MDDDVIDGEYTHDDEDGGEGDLGNSAEQRAIAMRYPLPVLPFTPESLAAAAAQVEMLRDYFFSTLKKDVDYGEIPGCDKPCLWKTGAETLATAALVYPVYEALTEGVTDFEKPLIYRELRCRLLRLSDDKQIGEGVGSCGTEERKYKNKYGKVNPDRAELANTVLKMAKKRAFVDAVLTLTGASRYFTQDMEDIAANEAAGAAAAEISQKMETLPTHCGLPYKHIKGNRKSDGKPYDFWVCQRSGCGKQVSPAEYEKALRGELPPEPSKPRQGEVPCPECRGELLEISGVFAGPAGKKWHSWQCRACSKTVNDEKYAQLVEGKARMAQAESDSSDPFRDQ